MYSWPRQRCQGTGLGADADLAAQPGRTTRAVRSFGLAQEISRLQENGGGRRERASVPPPACRGRRTLAVVALAARTESQHVRAHKPLVAISGVGLSWYSRMVAAASSLRYLRVSIHLQISGVQICGLPMSQGARFPAEWGPGCPPQDADPASGVVYRVTKSGAPAASDFLSWAEQGKIPKPQTAKKICESRGLSVFDDLRDARHYLEAFRASGDYIARATLMARDGRMQCTPTRRFPRHVTWWCFEARCGSEDLRS